MGDMDNEKPSEFEKKMTKTIGDGVENFLDIYSENVIHPWIQFKAVPWVMDKVKNVIIKLGDLYSAHKED